MMTTNNTQFNFMLKEMAGLEKIPIVSIIPESSFIIQGENELMILIC